VIVGTAEGAAIDDVSALTAVLAGRHGGELPSTRSGHSYVPCSLPEPVVGEIGARFSHHRKGSGTAPRPGNVLFVFRPN